jgi:hypothetical protein
MGIRGRVSRSTLADANETHDWRIFADFAQRLITIARSEGSEITNILMRSLARSNLSAVSLQVKWPSLFHAKDIEGRHHSLWGTNIYTMKSGNNSALAWTAP